VLGTGPGRHGPSTGHVCLHKWRPALYCICLKKIQYRADHLLRRQTWRMLPPCHGQKRPQPTQIKSPPFVVVEVRFRDRVRLWVRLPLFPNNSPSVRLLLVETLPSTPPTHTCKADG
jgi:hypothetical protein